MDRNFSVADAVGIQVSGSYFDLHNDFYLCELTVTLIDRNVCLQFNRRDDSGDSADEQVLLLKFIDVDYLDVSPGVLRMMICDIVELGYKKASDFDHDWLMSEHQAVAADHFFLRLSGDEFIRIHGNVVVATTSQKSRLPG